MNNPDFDINLSNSSVENQKTYFEIKLNGGARGLKGDTGEDGFSPIVELNKSGTVTSLAITDKNGTKRANIYDGVGGDMQRAVYDPDNNGIIDNAEKVNNHTVESDVPLNAVFTDTIYDDTAIRQIISTIQSTKSDIVDTGSKVELSIDNSTYIMAINLKDKFDNIISSDTIDLPLESVVVNGSYDSQTKEVVLTLQNGSTIRFSVADLVSGLQSEITSTNKLNSDLVDDTSCTNKFVTINEKQNWNNKYEKPINGITKNDLDMSVQNSLNLADTSLQSHQDITGKEDKNNKVTSISSSSTDEEYPSAKCVYDIVGDIATALDTIQREVI